MANFSLSSADRWLMERIRVAVGDLPVAISIGNSRECPTAGVGPVARVHIADRKTLLKLALDPEVTFGDGYMTGSVTVEGDLVRFLELVLESMQKGERAGWYARLRSGRLARKQNNSLRGSARNIHHHYDLTADFYKLWLDSRLLYTCAYFPAPSASLEDAQIAKMDHVCRKLWLQPGEKVVETGCGWGALALHMAKYYGVTVKAFNISSEQIAVARERAKAQGLEHRVEFIHDDYRNLSGRFDAFVSVGMLEHVGANHYAELARAIHRAIGDSGRGLLHFIGRNRPHEFSTWMKRRIFPGAYAPALSQVMLMLEPSNFAVQDVENIARHYALTLEHWLARFEGAVDRVTEMFGADFVRAWRLYLAGSLASFRVGALQLFQVVFAGSQCRDIPWTREHLYGDLPASQKGQKWFVATS